MPTTAVEKAAAAEREAERRQRSAVDEMLIQNARKSPEEIEAKTGIPAHQAMERLGFLLRSRGWMTDRQEERLLLIEMGDLIDNVKSRLENVSEQYYADAANVALRGYEAISKRIDARRQVSQEDMQEHTRVQAELYIESLREIVNDTINYIAEVHPDMDVELEETITAGFMHALPAAFAKIRGRVRE